MASLFFSGLLLLLLSSRVQSQNLWLGEVIALRNIATMLELYPTPDYDLDSCQRKDRNMGINCSCTQFVCHVTELVFTSRSLTGKISAAVGDLSSLTKLDLSFNQLQGDIPDVFGGMKDLSSIDLSFNFLGGPIPPSLGALPILNYLYLDENQLTGRIPEELGNLSSVLHLYLGHNELNGTIPETLGKLVSLGVMSIPANNLVGELPLSFINLTNLLHFSVRGNNLSGQIPEFIADWTNLRYLSLLGNSFEGVLPTRIFLLEFLITLWASDLGVSKDSTFPQLSKLNLLQNLILRNCSIADKIPEYIGRMRNLTDIDLSFNSLNGEIPRSLGNLKLNYLCLTRNNFSGPIPWLPNSVTMDFSYNNFSDAGNWQSNQSVNTFNCCNPLTLTSASTTKILNECPRRKYSSLHINCGGEGTDIDGTHYEEDIGNLPFYISPNKTWAYSLSGDFLESPAGPQNNTKNLTCGINVPDAPLYATARFSPLSLNYYGLCLCNGKYNVTLYFAEIIFTDKDDHSLLGERLFDITIQGERVFKDFNIKSEAGGPNKIFNKTFPTIVKNNQLNIHLYWAGRGSIAIPPTLYGPLISAISITPDHKAAKKLTVVQKALIGLVSAYVFSALILALAWRFIWVEPQYGKLEGDALKDYTFQHLLLGTENFSDRNKIGRDGGRIYRAVIGNNTTLAVKVIPLNDIAKGRNDEKLFIFANEVHKYNLLEHDNLVKLLGWYTDCDKFFLIYEYMENNSLQIERMDLNWTDRLKICCGVAEGLVYLHGKSDPQIIHGDIKPKNIFFDQNLIAKISGFGSARFYKSDASIVYTKFRGTSGYVAPEYARQEILSPKSDVFSYGVLLLEIVTGKENVPDSSNPERLSLFDEACDLYENSRCDLHKLVDESVMKKSDYSKTQAQTFLELAMLCTRLSVFVRPTMSLVLDVLHGKKTIHNISQHLMDI